MDRADIYPGTHYVTSADVLERAVSSIKSELSERLEFFYREGKFLEAQRLDERTRFDLEMLIELGFCHGIENYSRHLDGRAPGTPPFILLDYFPRDWLLFIDESHISVPQIRGMYNGDRARKETLVRYGFRLPSALDNRPLDFNEFENRVKQVVYVSATPGPYELANTRGRIIEQIIRPTGLVDPRIEVRRADFQVDDLIGEIRKQVKEGHRVLVTTLTKRMAEDLTEYLAELDIRVRYMHSDINTIERIETVRDLRLGNFDVLVGINLLREGLDIPEVSLVAVLDADNEGFLRSDRSLIQTAGRAARNVMGTVILYANNITDSMRRAIDETDRRRKKQLEYNEANNIVPRSVEKDVADILADYRLKPGYSEFVFEPQAPFDRSDGLLSPDEHIQALEKEMKEAASRLEFERAALLRDEIKRLREKQLLLQ